MNRQALEFFGAMANDDALTPQSVKLAGRSDFSDRDSAFILEKVKAGARVLELGAGTGLIVNKIKDVMSHVTAVEQFENFTQFIEKADNVDVVIRDVFSFEPSADLSGQYDTVLCFGLLNYMDTDEAAQLYEKISHWLHKDGVLIVKNQFGIENEVVVSGYSEEQKRDYVSQYRTLDTEKKLLQAAGFNNIEVTDIYPSECNRWQNTHFYALTVTR